MNYLKLTEGLKDLGTGLFYLTIIFAVVFAYGKLVTMGGFSETVTQILVFAPIILYAAYMMGGLRRMNKDS